MRRRRITRTSPTRTCSTQPITCTKRRRVTRSITGRSRDVVSEYEVRLTVLSRKAARSTSVVQPSGGLLDPPLHADGWDRGEPGRLRALQACVKSVMRLTSIGPERLHELAHALVARQLGLLVSGSPRNPRTSIGTLSDRRERQDEMGRTSTNGLSGALPVGRVLGVPFRLHWSSFLTLALVPAVLATRYFPDRLPGATRPELWLLGLVAALGLFGTVLLHELSHALMARRFDLGVAGIMLHAFGGVTRLEREPDSPRADFLMALVGPLSSVVMATVCGVAQGAGTAAPTARAVLAYLAAVNGTAAILNLVPGLPPRRRTSAPCGALEVVRRSRLGNLAGEPVRRRVRVAHHRRRDPGARRGGLIGGPRSCSWGWSSR